MAADCVRPPVSTAPLLTRLPVPRISNSSPLAGRPSFYLDRRRTRWCKCTMASDVLAVPSWFYAPLLETVNRGGMDQRFWYAQAAEDANRRSFEKFEDFAVYGYASFCARGAWVRRVRPGG